MQKVARHCDRLVGRGNNRCDQRVPQDEPVRFSVNGVGYEADLCDKHQEDFFKALDPFIHIAATTTMKSGSAVRLAIKGHRGQAFTTKDVRAWLQEQGREVAPSGRLPQSVIEEFAAAQANN